MQAAISQPGIKLHVIVLYLESYLESYNHIEPYLESIADKLSKNVFAVMVRLNLQFL